MTRLRPLLLLPLLAIAGCQTLRKPLTGYDSPPAGILLNQTTGSGLEVWTMFQLPPELQNFQPLLNGQPTVHVTSQEGFYDYYTFQLQGWTGGYPQAIGWVPADTYVVGLVDETGQSWGESAPLPVLANESADTSDQLPAVIFAHFDDQVGSWTVDPSTQDSDPTTDEITITNLVHEDVVVQRCQMTAAGPTACTTVGTVSAGADLHTVETLAPNSTGDYQALFVELLSDPSQSYERDLVHAPVFFGEGGACQIERIFVHGTRSLPPGQSNVPEFAVSTCVGYSKGT
jgi:hypothetical protein